MIVIMGLVESQDTSVIPSSNKDVPVSEGMSGPEVAEQLNHAVGFFSSFFFPFFSFSFCGNELDAF